MKKFLSSLALAALTLVALAGMAHATVYVPQKFCNRAIKLIKPTGVVGDTASYATAADSFRTANINIEDLDWTNIVHTSSAILAARNVIHIVVQATVPAGSLTVPDSVYFTPEFSNDKGATYSFTGIQQATMFVLLTRTQLGIVAPSGYASGASVVYSGWMQINTNAFQAMRTYTNYMLWATDFRLRMATTSGTSTSIAGYRMFIQYPVAGVINESGFSPVSLGTRADKTQLFWNRGGVISDTTFIGTALLDSVRTTNFDTKEVAWDYGYGPAPSFKIVPQMKIVVQSYGALPTSADTLWASPEFSYDGGTTWDADTYTGPGGIAAGGAGSYAVPLTTSAMTNTIGPQFTGFYSVDLDARTGDIVGSLSWGAPLIRFKISGENTGQAVAAARIWVYYPEPRLAW